MTNKHQLLEQVFKATIYSLYLSDSADFRNVMISTVLEIGKFFGFTEKELFELMDDPFFNSSEDTTFDNLLDNVIEQKIKKNSIPQKENEMNKATTQQCECDYTECCQNLQMGMIAGFRFDNLSNEHSVADLTSEKVRVYVNPDTFGEYIIPHPVALITRENGTTHRVVDSRGITHCIPANWIIQWQSKDPERPVSF